MNEQLRSEAARVIGEYTGWQVLPSQVEALADPKIGGLVAVQVTRAGETYQFLYNVFAGVDSVEEVEFAGGWPPLPRSPHYHHGRRSRKLPPPSDATLERMAADRRRTSCEVCGEYSHTTAQCPERRRSR